LPKGIPKSPTSLRAQLEHELHEIERRLWLDDLRERQRAKLAAFLTGGVPLLTLKDITRVVKSIPPDAVRLNSDEAKAALAGERSVQRGKEAGHAVGALGKAVRAYREKHKLTRTAFAKRLRVHESSVGFWERGKGASPDLRPRLGNLLGIDVDALIAKEAKANGHAGHA
jgi:DNA-binding transcriptional regulator YiaG